MTDENSSTFPAPNFLTSTEVPAHRNRAPEPDPRVRAGSLGSLSTGPRTSTGETTIPCSVETAARMRDVLGQDPDVAGADLVIGLGLSALEQAQSVRVGEELTRLTGELRTVIESAARTSAEDAARQVQARLTDPVESARRQVDGLADAAPEAMRAALDKVTGNLSQIVAAEVTAALDPARPGSPAAELVSAVASHTRETEQARTALVERIDALTGAKRAYNRSSYKGGDFEEAVADTLIEALSSSDFHVAVVGGTPGAQAKVLSGDILISDAEHDPVLVIECKATKITRERWGREMTAAQRNRRAPLVLGVCDSLASNYDQAVMSLTAERMVVAASEPGVLAAVVKLLLARHRAAARSAQDDTVDAQALVALVETMVEQVGSLGKAAENAKTASDKARTASDAITRTAGALSRQLDLILALF